MQVRLFVSSLVVFLLPASQPALGQVHLQSRTLEASRASTAEFFKALQAAPGGSLHGLATFSRIPTGEQKKALAQGGLVLLDPVHGKTYRVRAYKRLRAAALRHLELETALSLLEPRDKVAPVLWAGDFGRYVARVPEGELRSYVLTAEGNVNVLVRMHSGVPEAASEAILARHSLSRSRRGESTWAAVVSPASLRELARADIIQSIGAGDPPYIPENDKTRAVLNVDSLQTLADAQTCLVEGVTGRNVQVAVFHNGMDMHPDFASRVIRKDTTDTRPHPTHGAGTIAGNGLLSTGVDSTNKPNGGLPCQWRGIAPRAELIDARRSDGTNSQVHWDYIKTNGMDVANHSYFINADGDYDPRDVQYDELIRGDAVWQSQRIPARLQVMSAGNHGVSPEDGGKQRGYFSLTKQGKNSLVVGNWDTVFDRIYETSSLGPAYDGRIKPDVVAPGRTVEKLKNVEDPQGGVMSSAYCHIFNPTMQGACIDLPPGSGVQRRNFYYIMNGTSMAAHAATGVAGLMLEQYLTTYAVDLDTKPPLPSTLRGVMIHTARDLVGSWGSNSDGPVDAFAGPDFVTGWGLIDAQAAVETILRRKLIEDKVSSNCQVNRYVFTVPAGVSTPIRMTLAWDDAKGDADAAHTLPKLVNDLDLVLIDPGGNKHYPWQLDQTIIDAGGTEVPSESQWCNSSLNVVRSFMPTPNPATSNDPIPPAGLPQAKRGRDRLNNVEVVDAPAMEGTWMVEVSAFNLMSAAQTYSLIGRADATLLRTHPADLCAMAANLCSRLGIYRNLCERFPSICEPRIHFPGPGRIRIDFRDPRQKAVLPLSQLCKGVLDCTVLTPDTPKPEIALAFEATGAIGAAIYSSSGKLIRTLARPGKNWKVHLKPRRGEEYFLVVTPRAGDTLPAPYELKLELN